MYVKPGMREAAPDLCKQIDVLRKDRRTELNRHSYLKNSGKEVEADEALQKIAAIDDQIAPLHAAAKQKLIEGVATGLKEGSVELRNAARTNTDISHSLDEEIKRHSEAVKTLTHMQRCVGGRMNDAADAMYKAAVALEPGAGSSSASNPAESTTATGQKSEEGGKSDLQCPKVMFCNGDEEQVSKTEAGDAIPAPARSSTHTKKSFRARSSSDMRCPHCTMNCDGTRGLATQLGNCKKRKLIDV